MEQSDAVLCSTVFLRATRLTDVILVGVPGAFAQPYDCKYNSDLLEGSTVPQTLPKQNSPKYPPHSGTRPPLLTHANSLWSTSNCLTCFHQLVCSAGTGFVSCPGHIMQVSSARQQWIGSLPTSHMLSTNSKRWCSQG